ncbi:hypothetical protein PGTUg99_034174 [Puccinia graminis f. sp. tritici]|uniref:Uncharacterized protein n=1 Tax=Puccinia graminis f. sp. tritici TaxID=56615 RepID=A0A5B0SF88_PUCGR|nr:hypothetical protein PGTUg99_034174 [Puccinia graminis f. sp. tritici]
MSNSSQSDNDNGSPVRPAGSNRTNRSNQSNLPSHRTRPYPATLSQNGGGRQANSNRTSRPGPPSPPARPSGGGMACLFGRPGVSNVPLWPPSVVPFETRERNFDEAYVELLGHAYDLRAPYMDFAEDLVQVPSPRQYSVLPYSVLSICQAVESIIRWRDGTQNAPAAPAAIPLSVQARIYPYQNHFKTFDQNRAKEVLMCPVLDVYSSNPVRGAPPAGGTLMDQVLDHLRVQLDEFKLNYLPVRFITGELSALASINAEVRDRLKHEQGAMRNLVSTQLILSLWAVR